MTLAEMHWELEQEVDKLDSEGLIDLTPTQKDSLLTRASYKFVLNSQDADKHPTKRGFETDSTRIFQLSTLHVKAPEVQPAITATLLANTNNVYEVDFTNLIHSHILLTRVRADITKGNCTKTYITATPQQTDDPWTTFTQPSFDWGRIPTYVGRSVTNLDTDSLYLETNSDFTISNVYIDYLKAPRTLYIGGYTHIDPAITTPTESDLPDTFHRQIVTIAARLALSDIQNIQGVQTTTPHVQEDFS